MQIRDLGAEAIDEILEEARDGMHRRTGKAWSLKLDGESGDLTIDCDWRRITTANVQPHLPKATVEDQAPPKAIRFRSALRRLVLDATQAVSPVPGAANIPAALGRAFEAIQALDAAVEQKDFTFLPVIRHNLYRILDELTGCDHSGCTSKPSVADYGRKLSDMPVRMVVHEETDEMPWLQQKRAQPEEA